MYTDLAHLWPLVSPPEDYADEAVHWRKVLRAKLGLGRHKILELGVGGGHNLSHLVDDFQATAVDLSEEMLEHSRKLNPGVEHHVGDMRTFRLDRKFDAVLIHDAICYMLNEDDLLAAFATAQAHLEPGGVFVTAPDWYSETYRDHYVDHSTNQVDGRSLTLIEYAYDPDPKDTTIETVYFFVLDEGGSLRIEQDHHTTGLFPVETWQRLMEISGFDFEKWDYPVSDRGDPMYLLVGVAR